jgi:hypothetical protein
LHAGGHPLFLIDLNEDALYETANAARKFGVRVDLASADCTSAAEVEEAIAHHANLAILVNAVGGSAREQSCMFTVPNLNCA